jgi:tetratricopeptide (TPR) repeat protein
MARSQTYYLSLVLILSSIISGCEKKVWFKKNFSQEDKNKLAKQLAEGAGRYYQGSVPNMEILREGIAMDSTLPELWREMATPYLKRGIPYEAFRYYKKEIDLAPALWQGWRGYLYLYFYHDYHRAIADFNATDTLTQITDYPQGQSVDYMRGLCYYGLKEYKTALEFFTTYIDQVTKERGENWVDTYAFLYRGLTHEKLGQFERALKDFETGLKYDHRLSDFHFHKARVAFEHLPVDAASLQTSIDLALSHFREGYYHQRDYVEVHDQIYLEDIETLMSRISGVK